MRLLQTLPGVKRTVAAAIIAEVGVDMSRFPSAKHLASWAGMCPGNAESGGRRLSGRTRRGNAWVRRTLAEVANVASRMKGTYLAAQYRRIAARRGKGRAVLPVGHSILVAFYHMLTRHEPYRELGADYFDAPPARPPPAPPRSPLRASRLCRHPPGSHDILLMIFRRV
jgi:transposase